MAAQAMAEGAGPGAAAAAKDVAGVDSGPAVLEKAEAVTAAAEQAVAATAAVEQAAAGRWVVAARAEVG